VLINVTGGEDMTLHEVSEAADIVQEAADADANIIFGTVIDRAMKGKVKVTVIATGFLRDEPVRVRSMASTVRPPVRAHEAEAPPAPVVRAGRPVLRHERHGGPGGPGAGGPGGMEEEAFEMEQDEGYTPNFRKMKNDLDVPAFLRKQMD
jgi:cell division protein FtsZ